MIVYNKLVRDRIPEIIESTGRTCECRVLEPDEFLAALDAKLGEELKEYNESGDIEELADLMEVLYAIVGCKGMSTEEFEKLRLSKREKRGGFDERLLLISAGE